MFTKIKLFLITVLILLLAAPAHADKFRYKGHLISKGMHKAKILRIMPSPIYKDSDSLGINRGKSINTYTFEAHGRYIMITFQDSVATKVRVHQKGRL